MWIFLIILCSILLALHFFRLGLSLFMLVSLSIIPLTFIRKKWSYIIIQIIIFLGMLDWTRTLFRIISERILTGKTWLLAFIILFSVILVNFLTLIKLRTKEVRKKFYKIDF